MTGDCSRAALMSEEALRELGTKLVFHASVVSFLILLFNNRYWSSGVDASRSAVVARLAHHELIYHSTLNVRPPRL